MAGVWDKLMRFLGFGPEEEELDEEAVALEEAQEEPVRRASGAGRSGTAGLTRGGSGSAGLAAGGPGPNVVPIGAAGAARQPFKVLVVEPRSFDDVQSIADQLKNRRPVILNLEHVEKETAKQILNFLHGAIYALSGETQKIASHIFFLAPPGVDVANFNQGLRGAAGGEYDPSQLAELMAGAQRMPLASERLGPAYDPNAEPVAPRAPGQGPGVRQAQEKEKEKGRPGWDWRR